MVRKARVELEGAVDQVMDRGDRRAAIIGGDADWERMHPAGPARGCGARSALRQRPPQRPLRQAARESSLGFSPKSPAVGLGNH